MIDYEIQGNKWMMAWATMSCMMPDQDWDLIWDTLIDKTGLVELGLVFMMDPKEVKW